MCGVCGGVCVSRLSFLRCRPAIAAKALLVVLQKLRTLAPGQYLLTHKVEDRAVVILKAVDRTSLVHLRACGGACACAVALTRACAASTTPQKGPAGYDLHTSHASSGATDDRTVPYVRLIWPRELSDQVPHTFAPVSAAPGGPPSSSALAGGGATGQQQQRQLSQQLKKVKNVKYCFDYAKKVSRARVRGVRVVCACAVCVCAVC